jgi:penicillin-binding protein 2
MQIICRQGAADEGKVGRGSVVLIDVPTERSWPWHPCPPMIPIPVHSQHPGKRLGRALNETKPIPCSTVRCSAFVPGSTFKIPISFAGCLAGINTRHFNCSGSVTYGNKAMQCWIHARGGGSHGTLGLSDAIMKSCNCFFYRYGNAAGISQHHQIGRCSAWARGPASNSTMRAGILPNPDWLRANAPNERWSDGYTANTSIGQGMVLASPLQMASVTATVANGGKSWNPHLLKRVMDGDKMNWTTRPASARISPRMSNRPRIESSAKACGRSSMTRAAPANPHASPGVEVAGKTGTAQNWRRDERNVKLDDNHTWFISFRPLSESKICRARAGAERQIWRRLRSPGRTSRARAVPGHRQWSPPDRRWRDAARQGHFNHHSIRRICRRRGASGTR